MWLSAVGVLITFTLVILAAPPAAAAQQPVKRIGYLAQITRAPLIEAFRQALRELGYREGQNITIEFRGAEGMPERLPALAAELVHLNVDVIVAFPTNAVRAAQHATTVVPIVIAGADAGPRRDVLTPPNFALERTDHSVAFESGVALCLWPAAHRERSASL